MVNTSSVTNYITNFSFDNNSVAGDRRKTEIDVLEINRKPIKRFINEFWTSKQRQASSIHEVSYRACFKPQLPKFFIELLTNKGDIVYDPFSGRGTTILEAGLSGRNIISNDISPICNILSKPRFFVPSLENIKKRLLEIPIDKFAKANIDLSMFYHKDTEAEIVSLKNYLDIKKESGNGDYVDDWIRMVATNRLTGHSSGFFSVYTLPPNQAVTQESQLKINKKRNQIPPYRNTKDIILKKSKSLIRNLTNEQKENLRKAVEKSIFLQNDARNVSEIQSETVQLTVTSPPFLDIVQYSSDNWLRCWFNSIDIKQIEKGITMSKTIQNWSNVMDVVFKELYRITKPGGWVAFEVGEVRNGKIKLDECIVPLGINAGFKCFGILINSQKFTKTANIWGVNNNLSGTNTNRIVLFQKD